MEGSTAKRRRLSSSSDDEEENLMARNYTPMFQNVTINLMPREILSEIFQYLNFKDLKSVVLVCQYWRELGEDPFLWRKFCLDPAKVFQENFTYQQFQCNSDELTKLLNIPRLAMMEHLEINPKSVKKLKEEIFVSILNSNLSSLNIGYRTQLSNISPKTVSNVLNILKSVTLKAKLTNKQLEEFFESSEDSQLESLELCYNNLSKVSSTKLPELLAKLTNLTLFSVQTSAVQAENLFQQISMMNSIETLNMKNVDLYHVTAETLSNALTNNLNHLSLQNCMLDRNQVKGLLVKLVEGNNLTSLDLSGNDLSYASANMLATVVVKVETVGLREAHLNIEQIQFLFERIDEDSTLKHLTIAKNEDFKRVSDELKYKVGKLLASVDFQYDTEKNSVTAPAVLPVKSVKTDPLACKRCRFKGKTERGLKAHMDKKYCISRNCSCLHNVFRNRGR